MVNTCCIVGCRGRQSPGGVSMYRLPKHPEWRRALWIRRIRHPGRRANDGTEWQPGISARVCSDHFIGGKPSDVPNHPDFAPNQNLPGDQNLSINYNNSLHSYAVGSISRELPRRPPKPDALWTNSLHLAAAQATQNSLTTSAATSIQAGQGSQSIIFPQTQADQSTTFKSQGQIAASSPNPNLAVTVQPYAVIMKSERFAKPKLVRVVQMSPVQPPFAASASSLATTTSASLQDIKPSISSSADVCRTPPPATHNSEHGQSPPLAATAISSSNMQTQQPMSSPGSATNNPFSATMPPQYPHSGVKIKQEPADDLENDLDEALPRKRPRTQLLHAAEDLKDNISTDEEMEDKTTEIKIEQTEGTLTNDVLNPDTPGHQSTIIVELQEELETTNKTIEILQQENSKLKLEVQESRFTFINVKSDDLVFFTGLSESLFLRIFTMVSTIVHIWLNSLPVYDHLLLVMMKLRLGFSNIYLSKKFSVSESVVSNLINEWIPKVAEALKPFIIWPTRDVDVPGCSKPQYRKVASIIGCFEVFTQRTSNETPRARTWISTNTKPDTVKFLLSVTPTGAINFISTGCSGRTSYKQLICDSGYLDHVMHGDEILADRGFFISKEIASRGAILKKPAFTKGKSQLSVSTVRTRGVSNVHVHVQWVIESMQNFEFIRNPVDVAQVYLLSDAVTIISAIHNLKSV